MLTSSPKISDLIKNNCFLLNLAQNDEKVESNYFSADFRSFWDSLIRSLPMGFVERRPVMHLNKHIFWS